MSSMNPNVDQLELKTILHIISQINSRVFDFFHEKLRGHLTKHFVYWSRLCVEIGKFFKHKCDKTCRIPCLEKETVEKMPNYLMKSTTRLPLYQHLMAAKKIWDDLYGIGKIQGTHGLKAESNNLLQLEYDIYLDMDRILFELYEHDDEKSAYSEDFQRPFLLNFEADDNPDLLERKFFWFRYFGLKRDMASHEQFTDALHIYLTQEKNTAGLEKEMFSKVILNVIDADQDEDIDPDEWTDFVFRYGPIRECFHKSSAACNPITGELAPWFKHFHPDMGRGLAEQFLMSSLNSSTKNDEKDKNHDNDIQSNNDNNEFKDWKAHFCIRPGRNIYSGHVFSFSFLPARNNPVRHAKINIIQDGNKRVFSVDSSSQRETYHNVLELVWSLVNTLIDSGLYDKDFDYLGRTMQLWDEWKRENINEQLVDDSSQVQSLKKLFNIPDSIVPKENPLNPEDEGKILDMLAAKNSLELTRAYLNKDGLKSEEIKQKRRALQNFFPKHTGCSLTHEIVLRALEDTTIPSPWIDILHELNTWNVNLNLNSSNEQTPIQVAATGKSQNSTYLVKTLLELSQFDANDLHSLLETMIKNYRDDLIKILLDSNSNIRPVILASRHNRNIFHVIAETNPANAIKKAVVKVNKDNNLSESDTSDNEVDDNEMVDDNTIDQVTVIRHRKSLLNIIEIIRKRVLESAQTKKDMQLFQEPIRHSINNYLDVLDEKEVHTHKNKPRKSYRRSVSGGQMYEEISATEEMLSGTFKSRTPVLLAAELGNTEVLLKFRELGAPLDQINSRTGDTVLHCAVNGFDHFDLAQIQAFFVGKQSIRSKINWRNNDGDTALANIIHLFKESEKTIDVDKLERLILLLLEQGALVSQLETQSERNFILRRLHSRMEQSDVLRWTVLRDAVINGDAELVRMLLNPATNINIYPYIQNPYYDPDTAEEYGDSCYKSRSYLSGNLLRPYEFQQYRIRLLKTEGSLLHLATTTQKKNLAILEMLLYHSPDIKDLEHSLIYDDSVDNSSYSPRKPAHGLNKSLSREHTLRLKTIRTKKPFVMTAISEIEMPNLEMGENNDNIIFEYNISLPTENLRLKCLQVDINFSDHNKQTALHLASNYPHVTSVNTQMVESLFKKKISITKKDKQGWTALHYASYHNQQSIIHMLIAAHVDLETRTSESGDKGFQYYFEDNNTDTLRKLEAKATMNDSQVNESSHINDDDDYLEFNSERRIARNSLQSALHLAAKKGHWQVVSSLIKNGAQVDVIDNDGNTPLALAMIFKQALKGYLRERGIEPSMSIDAHETIDNCCPCLLNMWCCRGIVKSESIQLHEVIHDDNKHDNNKVVPVSQSIASSKRVRNIMWQQAFPGRKVTGNDNDVDIVVLQELLEAYDICIDVLLNHGASITTATDSSAKQLEELMDVGWEWDHIQKDLTKLEKQQRSLDRAALEEYGMNDEQRIRNEQLRLSRELVLKQKRTDIFADRSNQIVIDHVYSTLVRSEHIVRLFRYLIFLILLTLLGVYESNRDDKMAHFFDKALVTTLVTGEYDYSVSKLPRSFSDIDSKDEFYMWLEGPVTEVVYPSTPSTFWDGNQQKSRGPAYIHEQNRVVGVPRLRQIRSTLEDCNVIGSFKDISVNCMSQTKFETKPFGPSKEYTWSSQDELGDHSWSWGIITSYSGAGFVQNLPSLINSNATNEYKAIINNLKGNNWIDAKTRVVFFEIVLYNANSNHFAHVQFRVEFPVTGGTVTSSEITVVKLKKYVTTNDQLIIILEVIMLFAFLSHLFGETKQFLIEGGDYLMSIYNVLDVTIALLFICVASLHIFTYIEGNSIDWTSTSTFPGRSTVVARYTYLEVSLLSAIILLAWFKLLDYLSVYKHFSRLVVMIEMMLRQLMSFMVLLLIVLVAFASSEYTAYGYRQDTGYIWIFSFLNAFEQTFSGRSIVDNFTGNARVMGTLYSTFFTVFTSLLLLNLLIAIMNSAYEEALNESGDSYWATRQYKAIADAAIRRPSKLNAQVNGIIRAFGKKIKLSVTNTGRFIARTCGCCMTRPKPRVHV